MTEKPEDHDYPMSELVRTGKETRLPNVNLPQKPEWKPEGRVTETAKSYWTRVRRTKKVNNENSD